MICPTPQAEGLRQINATGKSARYVEKCQVDLRLSRTRARHEMTRRSSATREDSSCEMMDPGSAAHRRSRATRDPKRAAQCPGNAACLQPARQDPSRRQRVCTPHANNLLDAYASLRATTRRDTQITLYTWLFLKQSTHDFPNPRRIAPNAGDDFTAPQPLPLFDSISPADSNPVASSADRGDSRDRLPRPAIESV